MNNHHREQKATIISTAFSEWGKPHSTTMSLQPIAAKLSITKPALYRYFKSKDDLLETMVTTFAENLKGGLADFLSRSAPHRLDEAVSDYYAFLFEFFTARPFYLAFLLFYVLRIIKVMPLSLASLGEPLTG